MNQKFLNSKSNILIFILVVTAIVLGYLIYNQYKGTLSDYAIKNQNITPTGSLRDNNETSFAQRRPTPAELSAEEKAVLSPPAPDASQKEKGKHFDLVKSMAEKASVLELNACEKPTPLVFLVKKSQEFKVSNKDDQDHTIIIDRNHQYKIPANSTQPFKADFGRGNGAYGYLCDGLGGVVGFFFVTP